MKLCNVVGIETRFGFRSFELFHGDLTDPAATADLLVVSSFAGSYEPTPGTLIGALHRQMGISVLALARDPDYDLRERFGFWISHEVSGAHFARLLVVELIGGDQPIPEVIDNIFVGVSLLEAKRVRIETVALPMLGGGSQGIGPEEVIPALLPAAHRALERSMCLRRILFVEKDAARAAALDRAMNDTLRRVHVVLPKGQLIDSLRADVLTVLDRVSITIPPGHMQLVQELRRMLHQDLAKSFEVGLLGRRLAEFVADTLLARSKTSPDLVKKIDQLSELGVAPWIRGYLHTLRVLGNESAHEKTTMGRVPETVREEDLALCLFCIQRVVAFLDEFRNAKSMPLAG